MNGSDYIATELERRGVTHVFELVGGMITFLLDSIAQKTKIKIVSMHHEQGAGFAAEGYARMTGRPGVAMATSGPGATNLLTAIGSCYFDSTPCVFITGQVNRHEQRGSRAIRQLGFQETDIVSMAKPITKAAWLVNELADLPRFLNAAFELASSGRPGPVLLDVPMDVQRAEVDFSRADLEVRTPKCATQENPSEFWHKAMHTLTRSFRPLVLVGGGIRSAGVDPAFRNFVQALGVPVVNSLMGSDALAGNDPLRVGMIGSYGNRWANKALGECDWLLVLGSRLDIRQTGADTDSFRGKRKFFHVDCEPGEMNNRIKGCVTLTTQLREFIGYAISQPSPLHRFWSEWVEQLKVNEAAAPDAAECTGPGINPNALVRLLAEHGKDASAFVTDVGQHQMWAAQSLRLGENQRLLTSGGMGAMGFGLPAAIGACLASGKPVVLIVGDGGLQVNIQELQTVARLRLPIRIIVLNNGCHGMVRQFQEAYFSGRYQSTLDGYSAPDFSAVARAYGIPSQAGPIEDEIGLGVIPSLMRESGPVLIDVAINPMANAYPKLAFGRPITEMEPQVAPVGMEAT